MGARPPSLRARAAGPRAPTEQAARRDEWREPPQGLGDRWCFELTQRALATAQTMSERQRLSSSVRACAWDGRWISFKCAWRSARGYPTFNRMETTDAPTFPSDAYDAEGVDRTLIREMLELSPLERLERLEGFADLVLSVWERNGVHPNR